MGLADTLFGKPGDSPKKMAKKGLGMISGMEQRELMQSLLMQKLLQTQMGEANRWESSALRSLAENERVASELIDDSSRIEAARAEQAAANAGLSNVTGSINRRKAAAGRGAKEKRQLSAQRVGQQAGVRQAATGMRGQVRQGLLGVHQNIQDVKRRANQERLHLTTTNTPYGVAPAYTAGGKGILGTAIGLGSSLAAMGKDFGWWGGASKAATGSTTKNVF